MGQFNGLYSLLCVLEFYLMIKYVRLGPEYILQKVDKFVNDKFPANSRLESSNV